MEHCLPRYTYLSKASTFLCCLLFLLACKENDPLPKPTQIGADTFGCKVNGEVWIPNNIIAIPPSPAVSGGYLTAKIYDVYITAHKRKKGLDQSISIFLKNVVKPGTYSLNYDTGYYPGVLQVENHATFSTQDPDTFYGTTMRVGGTVTVTRADTAAKIVSGICSFYAVDKDGNQVKITDGRFDVKD